MMRRSIYVPGLEHGDNPIPAACRIGPFLATGAVRGVDRSNGSRPEDLSDEVRNAFDNLAAVIRAAGGSMGHIAHITVYGNAEGLRSVVNQHWTRWFPDSASRPARHVIMRPLPSGMRIQLEATAYIPDDE